MPIDALPPAPDRNDPATFPDRADAFVAALGPLVVQVNQLADQANALMLSALNSPGTLATSTTPNTIGTGARTFAIQTGKAYAVGQTLVAAQTSAPLNNMQGVITSHDSQGGSITIQVDTIRGGGTGIADWTLSLTSSGGTAAAAEIRAGTDPAKAITPKALFDAFATVALTDAASIAWDLGSGFNFRVTLAGNRSLANPTGAAAVIGKTGRLSVYQDSTGGRALAFGSAYKFSSGVVPSTTSTANAVDDLYYEVISATEILITAVRDRR